MTVMDLDQQLAELRSAADAYAARHQFIEDLTWPQGVRIAVNFTCDFDAMLLRRLLNEPPMQLAKGEFGGRVGIWRLVDLFDAHGVKATIFTPGRICELYPRALRAVVKSGHEIADHMWEHRVPKEPAQVIAHIHCDLMRSLTAEGHELAAHGFRHEDVSGLERDEEQRRNARTTEILADVVGRKPAGWFSLPRQGDRYAVGAVSPNTIDLLLEAGYVYLGNGLADDIPHYSVSDFASRRALLTLPYYYHFDDQFFRMFPRKGTGLEHPDALLRNWRGEFAAQYKRGRYFHMTLHPQHIGWSNRLQLLDEFLAELREYPSLWNPTAAECARYWLETYPAGTHLRLEPSIWQDYPGSLS